MTMRRGLFWPLVLIVIGLVFLLANFGLIPPLSGLALIDLWPLILILIGIDIAIGRRWPVAALVADVAVIGLGLVLVAANPSVLAGPIVITERDESGAPRVSTVTVPREDAKSLSLRLSGGAGRFTIAGGSSSDLVHASSTRDDLRIRSSIRVGDRQDVRLDQFGSNGFRFGPSTPANVDIVIANDVPTALQMDAGAGEFVIDLSDTKLTSARINVGAASLRVVLPKPTGDVSVDITAGASSVVIDVPDGVEARVTTTGALMSSRTSSRFSGSDTAGYATAKDRVTVRVTAGVSSVLVR